MGDKILGIILGVIRVRRPGHSVQVLEFVCCIHIVQALTVFGAVLALAVLVHVFNGRA